MTRKRYRKLLYALIQKMGEEYRGTFGIAPKDWGKVLKSVLDLKPSFDGKGCSSYQEMWDYALLLRKKHGMN